MIISALSINTTLYLLTPIYHTERGWLRQRKEYRSTHSLVLFANDWMAVWWVCPRRNEPTKSIINGDIAPVSNRPWWVGECRRSFVAVDTIVWGWIGIGFCFRDKRQLCSVDKHDLMDNGRQSGRGGGRGLGGHGSVIVVEAIQGR